MAVCAQARMAEVPKGEIGGFPYTRMALQPLATDSAEPGVT